ncbi:hypothetical protein C0991_001088, partial [Blastosporella zonata]
MSSEVIAQEYLFTPPGGRTTPKFVHEAIHDMESLFWVLIHTCITRKGPGIKQRRAKDLDPESPRDPHLYDTVY